MNPARLFLLVILPLAVGIGMVFLLPQVRSLVQLEKAIFWYPERTDNETYSEFLEDPAFQLTISKLDGFDNQGVADYRIVDQQTRDILGVEEMSPANWAYLLSELPSPEEKNLTIPSGLSWKTAGEVPLRALSFQLEKFSSVTIGLSYGIGGSDTLPDYLKPSVIPNSGGFPDDLIEVNSVIDAPSVEAKIFGFTSVKGLPWNTDPPLLVRWGNDLLPSLELAFKINRLGLKPSDVTFAPQGYLILGDQQAIIPITNKGQFIPPPSELRIKALPPSIAQFLLDRESQPEIGNDILLSESTPKKMMNGPIYQLIKTTPVPLKTYQRLGILFECSLIFFTVLLLQFRKWWLILPLLSAFYFIPVHAELWLPATPLLATMLAFYTFQLRDQKSIPAPSPTEEKPPAPSLGEPKLKRNRVKGPGSKKSRQRKSKRRNGN